MSEESRFQIKSLRDLFYIVFKHKFMIITIFVVALVGTGMYLLSLPDTYESTGKILIGSGQFNPMEMVTGMSGPSEISAEVELLQSRVFAESVVEQAGIEAILYQPEDEQSFGQGVLDYLRGIGLISADEEEVVDSREKQQAAIKKFSESLSVATSSRSNTITLSYKARTPELAHEILNSAFDVYTEMHIEMHTSAVSLEFLSEQTERLKTELETAEEEFKQFQLRYDIHSLPEQQSFLLSRIETLQESIQATEADIRASEASITRLKSNIDLREELPQEELRLESLKARLEVLQDQMEQGKQELRTLRNRQGEYQFLKRKVETLEENYRRYVTSLEQARIAQTLESQKISNISIMQKPTVPFEPLSQEKKKQGAMGLFLGLACGFGLAFITEYSNHKIKSIEELENGVGLENAIAFSTIDTKKAYRQLKAEVRTQPDVSLQLSPRTLSKNVTVWVYLREEVREFFENVRDMVFTELKKTAKTSSKAPYVLAVTSTYRGEGTSTIATGLAYTISLFENSNVLLVDSNTHHPNVDKVTGINRPKGLYEMNVSGVAGNDSGNGLHSMLSGNMSDYVNKVKAPDKIGSLLPAVEKMEYRIIILDLPSLSEGAAAAKAAGIADGTLLVVESERVRREVLQRAKEKLNKSGANIVGSVLNKRRYYIPKWIYQRF